MRRMRFIALGTAGIVAVAGLALGGGAAVADDETVTLRILNGSAPEQKAFVYGDALQSFDTSTPWTLQKDGPPTGSKIMAQPSAHADGGSAQPWHFGGRQQVGVNSPGESGNRQDSISQGEVLILERGELLEDQLRFFKSLSVKLKNSSTSVPATATVSAFRGDDKLATEELTLGLDETQVFENLFADVEGGIAFDRVEFTATDGRYALKGFAPFAAQFTLTPPFQEESEEVPDLRVLTTLELGDQTTFEAQALDCKGDTDTETPDKIPGTVLIARGDGDALGDPEPVAGFDTIKFSVVQDDPEIGCRYRISLNAPGVFDVVVFDVDDSDDADGDGTDQPLERPLACDGTDQIPTGKFACLNFFKWDVATNFTEWEIFYDGDAGGFSRRLR